MLNYDLLTGRNDAMPTSVGLQDMWRIFLTSLNARATGQDGWLYAKEIAVLSWILSQPYRRCYFSKPYNDVIMQAVENLSSPELTRIKKRLRKAKLIEEVLEDGRVRAYPVKSLFRLREAILAKGTVNFSFKMNVI